MKLFNYVFIVALLLLPVSANAGELERALSAFDHHDYPKAKQLLQPLADQGNPVAQYEIGVMYERGWGVEQDFKEAKTWLEKSANQEFSLAQDLISDIYDKGYGVPIDHAKAREWRDKANAPGNNSMQFQDRFVGSPRYRDLPVKYRRFPPRGVIPDEATAIQVVEVILKAVYGESDIKSREPFTAYLKGDVWIVRGHMLPPHIVGTLFEVEISKSRGCVLGIDDED